jgi:steroid delta-isomerase-like uncharacterized protein
MTGAQVHDMARRLQPARAVPNLRASPTAARGRRGIWRGDRYFMRRMTVSTMPTRPSTQPAETSHAEWGRSTGLLPHEAANLATIAMVAPLWSTHDIPALLEHYADDIVWRNVATGEVYDGKEAVRTFLERLFAALPDIELEVNLRLPRGTYVAEEYVLRGTHLGTMFGLPPTGRRVEITVMSLLELRDGLMKEDHFYFDVASVMRQMGYFPEASAAEKLPGRIVLGLLSRLVRRRSR